MSLFVILVLLVVVACGSPFAWIGLRVTYGPHETERQRLARQARDAERQVLDIGRRAQVMILMEALRRAQRNGSDDRP